jgi:hypothetical protein
MQLANTLTFEPFNSSPELRNVALWLGSTGRAIMVIDYPNRRWSEWSYDFSIDISLSNKAGGIDSAISHYEEATENGMDLLASADSLDELVNLYPEYFI